MKRALVAGMLMLSIHLFANAGTGPGGVGDTDGEGELVLWLAADKQVDRDENDKVLQWKDLSGHGNHADNGGILDCSPEYAQDLLNGCPGVFFDGSGDKLKISGNSSLQPSSVDIFAVARRSKETGWGDILGRPYFDDQWTAPFSSYHLSSCSSHEGHTGDPLPFVQVAVDGDQPCPGATPRLPRAAISEPLRGIGNDRRHIPL